MNNQIDEVKKIIAEKFGVPPDQIKLDANLTSDLNLSHLEISDLISICEENFNLNLPDGMDIAQIKTVSDLTNLIESYGEDL